MIYKKTQLRIRGRIQYFNIMQPRYDDDNMWAWNFLEYDPIIESA